MKRLFVTAVMGGVVLVSGGAAHQHVQSVRQAWQELEAADRKVSRQERQFLAESLKILGDEQEFRDSIQALRHFRGSRTERQKRFFSLSGNIISQLVSRRESDAMMRRLQALLNRRSILARRFDICVKKYRAGCAEGMRATLATWIGVCEREKGGRLEVPKG